MGMVKRMRCIFVTNLQCAKFSHNKTKTTSDIELEESERNQTVIQKIVSGYTPYDPATLPAFTSMLTLNFEKEQILQKMKLLLISK